MTVGRAATPVLLLLDVTWCFAAAALFVGVFGQGDGPAPSFVAVAAAVGAAFAISRSLQSSVDGETSLRALGVTGVVATIALIALAEYGGIVDASWLRDVLSNPGDAVAPNAHVVAGLIALAGVSVRGIQSGQRFSREPDAALTVGLAGLVVVALAALTDPATREDMPWGPFVLAYAVTLVVALVVLNAPDPDVRLSAFAGRWSGLIAALAVTAAGAALVVAAVDPDQFGALAFIGEPLRVFGAFFFDYVFSPVFTLLLLPFEALRALLEWLAGDTEPQPEEPPPPPERPERDDEEQPAWLRALGLALAASFMGLLVLGGLAILWMAFRRFAHRDDGRRFDRRERVEASSSLLGDLADLMSAITSRFPRRTPTSTVAIRQLYIEVLRDAEADGLVRAPAATPSTFAPLLDQRYRSPAPSRISDAFALSRYGGRSVPAAEVDTLRRDWGEALRRARGNRPPE